MKTILCINDTAKDRTPVAVYAVTSERVLYRFWRDNGWHEGCVSRAFFDANYAIL